jgi:hypothetical protein
MAKQAKKTTKAKTRAQTAALAARHAHQATAAADRKSREVWLNVTSTDPRKAVFVAKLKAASGCRKVTLVKISKDGSTIRGNCMNPNGPGASVGFMTAPAPSDAPPAGEVAEQPKEKTPARGGKKLVIQDACAAAGCDLPPTIDGFCGAHYAEQKAGIKKVDAAIAKLAGSELETTCKARGCLTRISADARFGRCPKHGAAFQAKADKVVKKVESEVNAQLASPSGKALMAELSTPPEHGFVRMDKPAARAEAMRITRALVAAGHRIVDIAGLCGVTDGSVYRWYRAASAPTPFQYLKLEELMDRAPEAKPKIETGSLIVAAQTAAKAVKAKRGADPRQLMLELRDALNAVLSATEPTKA